MKHILLTAAFALIAQLSFNQIVTAVSSLPEVNDELEYQTLSIITDEYLTTGEGVVWDFSSMYGDVQAPETYYESATGADFELFPESDMIIEFAGVEAYAKRNTTNIEVIGIAAGTFIEGLDEIEAQELSAPFITRRAPIGFGDTFSGETSFNFKMPIDPESTLGNFINGLNPFPDSTVDSLKAVVTVNRTEEVDGWGTAVFQNAAVPALRLLQQDQVVIGVELFLNTELIDSWLDISSFVDPDLLGFGNTTTTNYIFLGEESKEHLLEINIDSNNNQPTGRYSTDYYVGVDDLTSTEIGVYPNPVNDLVTVTGEDIVQLELIDYSGKVIISESYAKKDNIQVSLSEVASGVYILNSLDSRGNNISTRVIKN